MKIRPSPDSGAVYIFERNKGGADNWGQVKMLKAAAPSGDGFGNSVGDQWRHGYRRRGI